MTAHRWVDDVDPDEHILQFDGNNPFCDRCGLSRFGYGAKDYSSTPCVPGPKLTVNYGPPYPRLDDRRWGW